MSTPEHLTCHILPPDYKEKGNNSMQQAMKYMQQNGFGADKIKQLSDTTQWAFSQNTWDAQKAKFREEVSRLDRIRGEDFTKVFPEIGNLLRPDRVKLWPV
jgi:tetrahydromethanopterin S-methyltransferase subunit A